MGLETIGIWRGISSAIGLLGTCLYHWSVQYMTLEMTGMWSIVYEFLCLSLSYGSLFVRNDDHLSLILLITGVCMSRIGLWVFDIAVTQMMQESVPDGIRGIVGGVQQSLNAFFNLISYAIGIVLPNPSHFHIYVAAGYASVGAAMVLYGFEVCSRKRANKATIYQ
jgi:iron-regulated transporter 1